MVRELILKIIKTMVDIDKLEDDMNLFDDLALSSLEIFEIFSKLEEELNISINEDEISDIATIGEFVEAIENICEK